MASTMTLLATVQEFCDRRGLSSPSTVIGNGDDSIRQLRGLANEVVQDITSRGKSWAVLQKQTTFVSVASELQGQMDTLFPFGFKYLIEDSLYDRTQRRPLYGPRNAPKWQEAEALPTTGPFYSYRIWAGYFYLQPAPPAGHTIAAEYASDTAIFNNDAGPVYRKYFAADTDVFQLDAELLILGLQWKWRRAKGLSFSQEKLDFESALAQAIGTDADKGEVNLTGGTRDIRPGIFVPAGNWPL